MAASMMLISACGQLAPTVAEIPVGGARERITRQDLAAARNGMSGGLLEPTWLPDGFELVSVSYVEDGDRVESVDSVYDDGNNYVHIWQTHMTADELGDSDPVPKGGRIEGSDWRANPLPAAQVGREGVVEFSTRMPDGRTVTVDSDLPDDVVQRVLEALRVRAASGGA